MKSLRAGMSGLFAASVLLTCDTAHAAKVKVTTITKPVISCTVSGEISITVQICAPLGGTGLPAGFSVQYITSADLASNGGWPVNSDCVPGIDPGCPASFCKAGFSGNAFESPYPLAPGQCTTVIIGEALTDQGAMTTCIDQGLVCDTGYVFRAFGHATSKLYRSPNTADLSCATVCSEPPQGCTYTYGYWKSNGPIPVSNNSNEWPVTELTLGNVVYTDLELLSIMNTPAGGNGLIALAHQLIAAKLNVANGADGTAVAGAIASADALIGNLVVPPVGAGSLPFSATSSLSSTLIGFNEGTIGPGHCN
jgi:hypothetical protein